MSDQLEENPRKRVIVLISSLSVNRMYRSRQNRAVAVLKARAFPYEVVDGALPEHRERRDELFRISGYQSYPQFFIAEKKGISSFLGDFGIMERIHEADNLPSRVLEENPSLVTLKRVMEVDGPHERKLLFLSTSMRVNPEIVRRQERATEMIKQSGVPFEIIDGSNPQMKKQRDELFKISGRRGVYPQFYIYDTEFVDEDEEMVHFIGDWDHIEAINDASGLPQETLAAHPTIKTWQTILGNRFVEGVGSGAGNL